jgi:hypothetical protein
MNMNGLPVKKINDTLFVQLPYEAYRSCGICHCSHCKGGYGNWDTLAISPSSNYTWMVHMPEFAAK